MTQQIRQTDIARLHRPNKAKHVSAPATVSRFRQRHVGLMLSLLVLVLVPIGGAAWYLWERAADQFGSTVAFSVRREDQTAAVAMLGGIADLSGSTGSDTDVLYEYLKSQELVASLDHRLDLRGIWSRPGVDWYAADGDPLFALGEKGPIEELVEYWLRMVRVSYDAGSGLIEVQVRAFAPEDATKIASAILEACAKLINEMSAVAQEDTISASRRDLQLAQERLKVTRQDVTAFRNLHRLVDPGADIANQSGLLGELQGQLAAALIDADLLTETARPSDPRLKQMNLRIETIQRRIQEERTKMGLGGSQGEELALAGLVGKYEELIVDREFAEASYTAALASYDAAQAEARRNSRYLAPYIRPTTAESARYPERGLLLLYSGVFLVLFWVIGVTAFYSLRDRR